MITFKRLFLGSAALGAFGLFIMPILFLASLSGLKPDSRTSAASCQPAALTLTAGGASGLDLFLDAIRWHESRDDYTVHNPGSTASGAYQFLTSTWASEARATGYGQWAFGPASAAPAPVQDAVAGFMATAAFNGPAQGEWTRVADIWYLGHVASVTELDVAPPGNGGLTPRMYEAQIASLMSGVTPTPTAPSQACVVLTSMSTSTTVAKVLTYALAQVGKSYVWGATGPDTFDCSGLTMESYLAAGIDITRTTYTQVLRGTPVEESQLQPGDLVFPDEGHVQLYLGGGLVVEAPHTGAFVQVVKLWGFWQARRIV